MHPWPKHWVAIGRAVVYSARAAHAFSVGIKCRHSSTPNARCKAEELYEVTGADFFLA